MKRARGEEQLYHSNGIFSQSNLHSPPPHLPRATATTSECPPTSEETDSHDSGKRNANDGATIEVVRRRRGRPPGSKNKPKPPVVITRDSSKSSMGPYILELPPGVDVVESTTRFCRRRNMALCVLNGHGVVSNVSLKQPSATPGAAVTFHGRFDVLSISATIVPAGGLTVGNGSFTMFLAGPQGQVVGGLVVGPLVAAGTVYLIAATFNNPSFDRLQQADINEDDAARNGGCDRHESPQAASGGDSGGAPTYSCQPSDVIWAPTAVQPRAPPPPF